jgi:hypothetical protein
MLKPLPSGVRVVDWRAQGDYSALTRAANNGTAKAKFDKSGKVVMRSPASVRGIMWHITAVEFGVSSAAVQAAGGDRELARNLRAKKVPAHALHFRDGTIVLPFHLLSYLYHGNAGNEFCLGVEVESKDGSVTPAQVAGCLWLADFFVDSIGVLGGKITETWAHRQTHGGKPNDPGPAVWKKIAIPSSEALGLTRTIRALPRSTQSGRDGSPIPLAWDPLGV